MYIPQTNHLKRDLPLAPIVGAGSGLGAAYEPTRHSILPYSFESILFLARWTIDHSFEAYSAVLDRASNLRKRSSADSVNTTIGVTVGILVAAFVIGFFAFFYFYGRSIRVVYRKRHRHRKSSGSKGSKNSDGAAGEPEPPAPAPA